METLNLLLDQRVSDALLLGATRCEIPCLMEWNKCLQQSSRCQFICLSGLHLMSDMYLCTLFETLPLMMMQRCRRSKPRLEMTVLQEDCNGRMITKACYLNPQMNGSRGKSISIKWWNFLPACFLCPQILCNPADNWRQEKRFPHYSMWSCS